jgi:hypothetical protein
VELIQNVWERVAKEGVGSQVVEVTGELGKFHSEELHNFYFAVIVRVNKSARTRSRRMYCAWGR